MSGSNFNLRIESNELQNLLLEGCRFTEKSNSNTVKASVDYFIESHLIWIKKFLFNSDILYLMLEIFICMFIKGQYNANKTSFLKTFFSLSCEINDNSEDYDNIRILINEYGVQILIYVIENMDGLNNYTELTDFKLNFQILSQSDLSEAINLLLTKKGVFNAVYFLEKMCKNVPKFTINNSKRLIGFLNEKIDEQNWDDFSLVAEFMKKNELMDDLKQFINRPIPTDIKYTLFESLMNNLQFDNIDDLISTISTDSKAEYHNNLFEKLFNKLMENESIATNYLIILFDKFCKYQAISPSNFLETYFSEYERYEKPFLKAFNRAFTYNPANEKFIRKVKPENIELQIDESINSTIRDLFKYATNEKHVKKRYQSFLILKSIASSFPFLFTNDCTKMFDSLLPSLDHFSLYFTMQQDRPKKIPIKQLKITLTAISFVHSILYSTAVLDAFVPWFFEKVKTFTESQILSFLIILNSLFQTNKVKAVLLSLSMKYKLIDFLHDYLKIQKSPETNDFCNRIVYNLITVYYKTLNGLSKKKILLVNQIKNYENPFTFVFDNFSTILRKELKPICLIERNDNNIIVHLNDYFITINTMKPYWATYNFISKRDLNVSSTQIQSFISAIQEIATPFDGTGKRVPYINSTKKIKAIEYLLFNQPKWVYDWIHNYRKFSLTKEHYSILMEAYEIIKRICSQNEDGEYNEYYEYYDNDDDLIKNIDINDYFWTEYYNESFLKSLIIKLYKTNDEKSFTELCTSIKTIISNNAILIALFELLERYIVFKKSTSSLQSIDKIINLLISISDNEYFSAHFVNSCGTLLIDTVLSPSLRSNPSILSSLATLLNLVKSELPPNTNQLISFIFLLNQVQLIPDALKLCSKLNKDQLQSVNSTIQKVFIDEISKPEPSFVIIRSFLEDLPFIVQVKKSQAKSFIGKMFEIYKQSKTKNMDLITSICLFFNILAPEKNEYEFIFPYDSKEIDFSISFRRSCYKIADLKNLNDESLLNPLPSNISKNDFWNLYEKHRKTLSEIIEQNGEMIDKMPFLFYFPELLSFEKRISSFRKKMSTRVDTNERFSFEVDRNNILKDSFAKTKGKTPTEWLQKMKVYFENENGIDAGGLTREWFTLIIKEIFDPEHSLFEMTDNNSYIPKKSSKKLDEAQIEYYRFAGKVIARALVEGICINAHLTRSFCRQIQHRQIKLRDLEDYELSTFNSFKYILDNDVTGLGFDFTINPFKDEKEKNVLLIENGDNIEVTNENKKKYVSLYVNYILRESIIDQLTAFSEGFDSIIHPDDIRFFTPNELDLLICGVPEIDVEDLMKNTEYTSPYNINHPVIKLFFKTISKWSNKMLAKLLLFITGTSQVPINGFSYFKSIDKPIKIGPGGEKERLCVAHTCFNKLDLPSYETEEQLNFKLAQSIQVSEFGLG